MSVSRGNPSTVVRVCALLLSLTGVLLLAPPGRADETVQVCGSYANNVFARTAPVHGITVQGT